jgi:hypothetical protein
MYFNMFGVVYLLLHSIWLRKNLVALHLDLDRKEVSPSDFAILVRNIGLNTTKQSLQEAFEKRFQHLKLTVSYVNLCYNIEEMVSLQSQIKKLVKQKGFYKLSVKKQMKTNGLGKH